MLGDNIYYYCRLQKLKINQLALKLGISSYTAYSWVSNRADMPAYKLYEIAEILNVPIEKFFEDI